MKDDKKKIISRICLTIIDREFNHQDINEIGINKEDVITITHSFDGKVYLYYWNSYQE